MSHQSIVQWFAPPALARVDLRDRARALWMASWPFFVVVTALLAFAVLVDPATLARRATTIAVVGAFVTALHMTSRAGRPILASWLLVTGLSVIVTQRAWITGGIHAPVALFYAVFVVMAGVLLDARGALVTAAACTLGATVLTIGTMLDWAAPRPGAGSALGGFAFTMLAIGLALVLDALVRFRPRREGLDADAVHLLVGDMRSPMQVLVSRLEVLRAQLRGDHARDAAAALEGVWALRRMTNSLLDVTRLQAGRMPVRRSNTDLSGLAHDIVTAVRAVHPSCDIAVETRGDPLCNCDPDLTGRTIETLMINAMVVTPADGRVRVLIGGSWERASIAVMDEGPAVPLHHRTRIFEPYRFDCLPRTTTDASGLGLAFCRLAIEAQGGTIRVDDNAPRGNMFVVELARR